MADIHSTCKKRIAFAWAKYYDAQRRRIIADNDNYQRLTTAIRDDTAIPAHITALMKEMSNELKKTWVCPICLEFIKPEDLEITNCGHFYCKPCLTAHRDADTYECRCPVCRRKI